MFGSVLHDITSIFAEYKTTTATKWRACIEDCPHPEVCPHPDSCPHRSYMLTLRSSSPPTIAAPSNLASGTLI